MYTHSIMKELQDRREKERHLAINTVVTIRVSKPFAANLQMKSMIHNSNPSEMMRLLAEVGSKELGWDMDNPF